MAQKDPETVTCHEKQCSPSGMLFRDPSAVDSNRIFYFYQLKIKGA